MSGTLYPYLVRVQDGRETRVYASNVASAAIKAECKLTPDDPGSNPATLTVRADEPWIRHPSRLRRLLDWWES